MITFDQILLLQEKIESAANKIKQLQAENDALRSKCAELTNALSTKSELLSSFESEQSKIENGILHALNRLNAIENSVLHSAGNTLQPESTSVQAIQTEQKPVQVQQEEIFSHQENNLQSQTQLQNSEPIPQEQILNTQNNTQYNSNDFNSALDITEQETPETQDFPNESNETPLENNQFDIF